MSPSIGSITRKAWMGMMSGSFTFLVRFVPLNHTLDFVFSLSLVSSNFSLVGSLNAILLVMVVGRLITEGTKSPKSNFQVNARKEDLRLLALMPVAPVLVLSP